MDAFSIAEMAHKGQTRRDGITPYFNHCLAVAKSFDIFSNEHKIALLHDVLEDTHITVDYLIQQGISHDVIYAVIALTKKKEENYEDYLKRVVQNKSAIKVKIKDILHNLSDNPTKKQMKKYGFALSYLADYI